MVVSSSRSAGAAKLQLSYMRQHAHANQIPSACFAPQPSPAQIPSDQGISFDQAPAMKAQQIAAATRDAILSGQYDFVRCNFANPGGCSGLCAWQRCAAAAAAAAAATGAAAAFAAPAAAPATAAAHPLSTDGMELNLFPCNCNPVTA